MGKTLTPIYAAHIATSRLKPGIMCLLRFETAGSVAMGTGWATCFPAAKRATLRRAKDWQTYIAILSCDAEDVRRRTAAVGAYLSKYGVVDMLPLGSPELVRLYEIREQVLLLLAEADRLAALIRPEAG